MIAFHVAGTPAPKGSLRGFMVGPRGRRHVAVTEDNPRTRPWSALVREAASQARARYMRNGGWGDAAVGVGLIAYPKPAGVVLSLEFAMPRPVKLPKRRSMPHVCKPDLDKLTRAVKDALTGVVWTDDAQVVTVVAVKRYAGVEEQPGVTVVVRRAIVSWLTSGGAEAAIIHVQEEA